MDIVERLRVIGNPVSLSAADEIERLRAELAAERELADRLAAHSRHASFCPEHTGSFVPDGADACVCTTGPILAAWRERRAT